MSKVAYAARFASITFLLAGLYTGVELRPGLHIVGVLIPRLAWVLNHPATWQVGWWLWLLAIFGWMWLLTTLMWAYLPAHRVATMLQSGLLISAVVLTMSGIVVWMQALPILFRYRTIVNEMTPVLDALALGLLGAGLLLGGLATAWVGWDLWQQQVLPRPWVLLLMAAGVCTLPSPWLLPNVFHLLGALLLWLSSTIWLAARYRLPSPFAEWPVGK
jgi:hypothetical protein